MNLEELLEAYLISVYPQTFKRVDSDELGQPKYEYGIKWWKAYKGKVEGEGASAREAVEQLVAKLTR